MSRRGRGDSEESLDLLLDTITNAFGGIVFMAILLAVLVRNEVSLDTTMEEPQASRSEFFDRQREWERLNAEAKSTQATIEQLGERLAQVPGGLREKAEKLRELESRCELVVIQQRELEQLDQQIEVELANTSSSAADLMRRAAELNLKIEQLEQRLSDEVEKRTTTSGLPLLRETTKREVAILIRRGRIVEVFDTRHVINDSLIKTSSPTPDLRTRTGDFLVGARSGINSSDLEAFRRICQQYDANHEYFALAIWEDSFHDFAEIKKVLVELHFEHRLLLMSERAPVSLEGSGGGRVQ